MTQVRETKRLELPQASQKRMIIGQFSVLSDLSYLRIEPSSGLGRRRHHSDSEPEIECLVGFSQGEPRKRDCHPNQHET
jgi:hypothetical protein